MKKFKTVFNKQTYEIVFGYDNISRPSVTTATLLCPDKKVLAVAAVKRYHSDPQDIKIARIYATSKVVGLYFKANMLASNTFDKELGIWQP